MTAKHPPLAQLTPSRTGKHFTHLLYLTPVALAVLRQLVTNHRLPFDPTLFASYGCAKNDLHIALDPASQPETKET